MRESVLNVKEAARRLGLSTRTVYLYLETQRMQGLMFAGQWRIDPAEVDRFLREGTRRERKERKER